MKRLLDDFAARFDLDYQVHGVRIAELVRRLDFDLDKISLEDWGTAGPADKTKRASKGAVDLHYVPHLFPEMDFKLRLAHRLQYHLLPKELPPDAPVQVSAVLESYCHLSGDLFGWDMTADGEFLIWILDMSGHGLETGLASALLHLILDALRSRGGLVHLMSELSDALHHFSQPCGRTMYATGFFLTLGGDGTASYCSAGHLPALVSGPEGELRELGSNSRPIGLFPGERFKVEQTRIEPGETLFLYTDGLVELTTHAGEQFGLDRLRDFLRLPNEGPQALTDKLFRHISESHDMTQIDDDVTFVAAKMRQR